MTTRIYFPEKRDFVKACARLTLLLVIGAIWCFGSFGGYADAEDLMEVKKVISFEKKVTVEDHLRKKIMELEKSGREQEARKTRNRLEAIIQLKREYSEKMKEEERKRQVAITQKYLKEYFSIKHEIRQKKIRQNKGNQWTPRQIIAFGISSLIAGLDAIQTGNIPPRTDPPIWHMSEEQKANMSVEEIIKAYNYTEYKENNPLITSLFGKRPSGGEMFLYYVGSTAVWFGVCHYGPRLYNVVRDKVPAIRYIIPDIIEDNIRNIALGAGIANYSYWVLNNLRVTSKGIVISHEF